MAMKHVRVFSIHRRNILVKISENEPWEIIEELIVNRLNGVRLSNLQLLHLPEPVAVALQETLEARMYENVISRKPEEPPMRAKISQLVTSNPSQNFIHFIALTGESWKNFVAALDPELSARIASDNREKIAHAARGRTAPSDSATTAQQQQIQRSENDDPVYNWRPLELSPPPIEPYFPPFSEFARDLDSGSRQASFTSDELQDAFDVVIRAVAFYDSEEQRLAEILKSALFQRRSGRQWKWSSKSRSLLADKDVSPGVHRLCLAEQVLLRGLSVPAHPEFAEFRAESGEGSSDAITQAERSYVATYASDSPEARCIRKYSCCPAVLVGISGPHIIFSGAIFAHALVSQRLTGYLFLGPLMGEEMDNAARRVARLIRALNKLRTALDKYYSDLYPEDLDSESEEDKAAERPLKKRKFDRTISSLLPKHFVGPTYSKFSMNGKTYNLKYLARLDPDVKGNLEGKSKSKAVFRASAMPDDSDGTEDLDVVVKFTRRYSKQGHELLARQEPPLAPPLHFCEQIDQLGKL